MTDKVKITAASRRKLGTIEVKSGATTTMNIPRDTVFRNLQLVLRGSIKTEYASGTPIADPTAMMNRLINNVQLQLSGQDIIKSIPIWAMKLYDYFSTGKFPARFNAAGAEAVDNPTNASKMIYGTTGQISSTLEIARLNFENVVAGVGRHSTYLDTRGTSSCQLNISFAEFKNLLIAGNDADVNYTDDKLYIDIYSEEVQYFPVNTVFSRWKQTTLTTELPGNTTEKQIELIRGNAIQSVMFLVREVEGAKAFSNDHLDNIQLIINGTRHIQNVSFRPLQLDNIIKYGLNEQADELKGVAYLDILSSTSANGRGNLNSAQLVVQPTVDQVVVKLSNKNSSACTVTMITDEIVAPVSK